MPTWFAELSPVWQALLAGVFTWGVTALGAALVFVTRPISQRLLDAMLGFAGGVMIAASVWSLILPALEYAASQDVPGLLPALTGLAAGYAFVWLAGRYVPAPEFGIDEARGDTEEARQRTKLLVFAMTLHNVPEGLAVGVAFGAAASGIEAGGAATVGAAVALALGIGLQNFPEGIAVSLPLRREGASLGRAFWYGQLSAFVEPVAAASGAAAVMLVQPALPYALAFAAGAMLFVAVQELIPTSQEEGHQDTAVAATMFGFAVMMTLDIALG